MPITRRRLLRSAALLPLAAISGPVLEGCSRSGPICADPEVLSTSEAQLRRTLGYAERAPDSAKQCRGCHFFRASGASEDDCGHCEILDGAVNRLGSCRSWAKRA